MTGPKMGRKRGNPNWGKPSPFKEALCGVVITEFDQQVKAFGLDEETMFRSTRLKAWVLKHKNHRWVPEALLKAWNIDVTLNDRAH